MTDDGFAAIPWHDTVHTHFLSKFHNSEEESSVFRRIKASGVDKPAWYRRGGTDQLDSLLGNPACDFMSMNWLV